MADAWTSYGGSQFIDSASTGPYMSYLCDEVVPFVDGRYPTLPGAEHRGLTGKSSGGYGAMVVPMLRPDVFGGLASHSGDAEGFIAFVRRLDNHHLKDRQGRVVTADAVVDHDHAYSIYFCDPYGHQLEVTTYEHDTARTALLFRGSAELPIASKWATALTVEASPSRETVMAIVAFALPCPRDSRA